MYKRRGGQISIFEDETFFGGVKLDSSNQWVKLGKLIPWESIEKRYVGTFSSNVGSPGLSCRMAMGSLVIQKWYGFSDEDTRQEIRMNPYLQYFIGLSGFQHEAPFGQSTMTLFRKRVTPEMLAELSDFIMGRKNPYEEKPVNEDEEKARLLFLRKHPLCAECLREKRLTPATVVDHIVSHRGDERLFWDEANRQPLCKACHDKKTGSSL